MKLVTFLRFFRQLRGKKPVNIEAIQSMGLLAVKLGQIFALRPDLIEPERCIELQRLYSRGATIPKEDSQRLLNKFAPEGFMSNFHHIEPQPFSGCILVAAHTYNGCSGDASSPVAQRIRRDGRRRGRDERPRP